MRSTCLCFVTTRIDQSVILKIEAGSRGAVSRRPTPQLQVQLVAAPRNQLS
jgi:hypothetical protein